MSQAVTVVVVVAVIFHSLTLSGQRHFFRHIIIKNSTNQRSLACIFIFFSLLDFISFFVIDTSHMHCCRCCSCLFSVFTFVYICFASPCVCVSVVICCFIFLFSSFSRVFCNGNSAWCSIVVIMCYSTILVRWLKSPCNCETTGAHIARLLYTFMRCMRLSVQQTQRAYTQRNNISKWIGRKFYVYTVCTPYTNANIPTVVLYRSQHYCNDNCHKQHTVYEMIKTNMSYNGAHPTLSTHLSLYPLFPISNDIELIVRIINIFHSF